MRYHERTLGKLLDRLGFSHIPAATYLRHRWLSNHIFDYYDAILDAWNRLIAEPARFQSIGSRQWAINGEA